MTSLEVHSGRGQRRTIDSSGTMPATGNGATPGAEESQCVVKMLLRRRTLSRATITLFTMLVLMVVMCQGQGEVLIHLKDDTAPLGGVGKFFCKVRGDHELLRFNGTLYDKIRRPAYLLPDDIDVIRIEMVGDNMPNIISLNITIEASVARNNTIVSCGTVEQQTNKNASTANFTVQGAPAMPEVTLKRHQKTFSLSWPRPFTWEEYDITSYHAQCRNTETASVQSETITDNSTSLSVNLSLPDVKDCTTVQCYVTASNVLATSAPAVTSIFIPMPIHTAPSPTVEIDKVLFDPQQNPQVKFCIKLPTVCLGQNVTYTITIRSDKGPPIERSTEFSYRNHTCVNETFSKGLEEGMQYHVQVFLDGGPIAGNSSSVAVPFKPDLGGTGGTGGVSSNSKSEPFLESTTGLIVIIAASVAVLIVLLIVLLVLITTIVVVHMKKGRRSRALSICKPKAPVKRTITPMVNNPIYGDENPVYEHISEQTRPPYLDRLNSNTSHTNLDSPHHHLHSPTHSARTPTPTSPHHSNKVPPTPTSPNLPNNDASSPTSSNSFHWPYSTVRPTDPATFDAIEAEVENVTRAQARVPLPSSTPGDDSYMTMHSVANNKNVNVERYPSRPHYAVDLDGNRYIEC